MTINRFEDLECWQDARELCKYVERISLHVKFKCDLNHVEQIKNSSGSAIDNIAEGFGRNGNKEFINFLYISIGSACETKSQIIRAYDKNYINEEEFKEGLDLAEITIKKTSALATYLKNSGYKGSKFK